MLELPQGRRICVRLTVRCSMNDFWAPGRILALMNRRGIELTPDALAFLGEDRAYLWGPRLGWRRLGWRPLVLCRSLNGESPPPVGRGVLLLVAGTGFEPVTFRL